MTAAVLPGATRSPGAARLHYELAEAVERHGAPCRGRSDWTDDDRDVRAEAAAACQHCPVTALCGTYAHAADERFGVWAGRDRTTSPSIARRRATAPHDHEEKQP